MGEKRLELPVRKVYDDWVADDGRMVIWFTPYAVEGENGEWVLKLKEIERKERGKG